MNRHLGRASLLALIGILLVATLASIPGTVAATPSYTLTGILEQPSGADIYRGVQVDLVNQATGAVYTTTTGTTGLGAGQFLFTTSSTSGALAPGWWGIYVPPQTNTTLTSPGGIRCSPCAALATTQTPAFGYYTASTSGALTSPGVVYSSVSILSYSVTISGTVTMGGSPVLGAPVDLLAPTYNGVILYNTTTNTTTGAFSLKSPYTTNAPNGAWVLQSYNPGPPNQQNSTKVVVTSGTTLTVNPNIQSYFITGRMYQAPGVAVLTSGNATLFDPATGFIYSTATAPGGYYQLGTYGLNFGAGTNTLDLFLTAAGFGTVEHTFTTAGPNSPVTYNVVLPRLATGQRGLYDTTLNFTGFDNATGTGNLTVSSTATLGNNTLLPNLPNGTVAQLWTQLGLDFNQSTSIPAALLPTYYAYLNTTGPVFPALQAGTNINGTGFLQTTTSQNFTSVTSGCTTTYCGASTSGSLSFSWSNKYALNGSVYMNSSTYSVGFGFRHPGQSDDIYNYTVVLPTGYVLKAGTAPPTDTKLIPLGVDGTWSSFTLQSLYDASPAGSLNFTIVSATTLTAIVNVTVPTYFAFSDRNVYNDTNGNYTVAVGVNQNVTFSAANTIYPAGINGTKFSWDFGGNSWSNVTTPTTYHYFSATTPTAPDTGTLTVTASNRVVDSTKFFVWVASGPAFAGILSNASSSSNRTVNGVPYIFVNWGTVLYFNASGSFANITPTTTAISGVLAVASFSLVSKGFSQSANYSASSGAYFGSNWTVQFLGAGSYLSNGTIRGNSVMFRGWQYNLTLKIWSGTGQTSTQTIVILVNDTEKPVAAFQVLNSAGTPITSKSITAGSNLSAQIQLNGANSTDPHNGSISRYYWLIGLTSNGSVHYGTNATTVKPYPKFWLSAATTVYWVNLTVWDLNGNKGWTNQTLTVAANTTTTPILSATNLTGPSKMSEGSSYTFWVNVTVGGGTKSTATNVQVTWYTTAPGGTTRRYIAGTPGSVTFYNYTSKGVPNTVVLATGVIPSLAYNTTVRAVITWSPPSTGNFQLYANATASNEFTGDYSSGTNVASTSITVNPNPTTQLLEYIAIAAAVVVVIALIVFYVRRRGRASKPSKSTGKSGLERGGKRAAADEDEEDDSS